MAKLNFYTEGLLDLVDNYTLEQIMESVKDVIIEYEILPSIETLEELKVHSLVLSAKLSLRFSGESIEDLKKSMLLAKAGKELLSPKLN